MRVRRDKKGNIVQVELDKGEQLELIKENLRRCRDAKKEGELPTDEQQDVHGVSGVREEEQGAETK